MRVFAGSLAGASATAAANPAVAGHVLRYLNSHEAIVRSGGGKRLAISSAPLEVSQGGGRLAPVDLHLRSVSGGFAPANPVVPLLIGSQLSGGVEVGRSGVRLTMQGADVGGQLAGSGAAMFANVATDTDALVLPAATGVELDATLRSPLSPEVFRYEVSLPRGASLKATSRGAVDVLSGGRLVGVVSPPVAVDAQGSAVPVKMTVAGSSLVLDVAHREASLAYPILVDPTYTLSATDAQGSWAEFGPATSWDAPNYNLASQYLVAAGAGKYVHGGLDRAGWEWYPPISSQGNSTSWTVYNVDLESSDPVTPYAELVVGCQQATASNGQTVIAQQLDFPNNSCSLNPTIPIFMNRVATIGGIATGDAVASFGSFLVTTHIPCPSAGDCPTAGSPIGSSESLGGWNGSEATGGCNHTHYPVQCGTGDFWHTFSDVRVPGRGLPLALTRTYNSLDAATQGPFGYGWSSSYTMHLTTDSRGNVTVHQENGATVSFTHNADGSYSAAPRVIATLTKNADGTFTFIRRGRMTFAFSADGRLLSERDLNGNTTSLAYNSSNQLVSVTDPSGRQLTFSYGSNGDVATVTDPGGHTVAYGYDAAGDLSSVTDLAGGVTRFDYDSNHLLTKMTDPLGGTVSNSYDSQARVLSQTDPMNRTTTFSYSPVSTDSTGMTSSTTTIGEPNGSQTVQNYTNGEIASITKASGTSSASTWSYQYDLNSAEVNKATDPNGNITKYTYDGSGNLLQKTDALNRQTTYTYNGLEEPTSITTPLGHVTTLAYDSSGNLTSVSRTLTETGQVQQTSYGYDSNGELTSLTDPRGHTWTYGYDGQGDRTSATSPLGHKTTYGYDSDSRLVSMVSADGNEPGASPAAYTTAYTNDAAGRVTDVKDPRGHETKYAYDGDGNLTDVTDRDGRHAHYDYDADGALVKVTRGDGSTQQTGYDAGGQITSQTDGNNHTTSYQRDALEQITKITDPLGRNEQFAYDKAGNLVQKTDQTGASTSYGYDADNELTSIHYSSGNPGDVSFQYDADGNRTQMTDQTGLTAYTYDSLDRLTASTPGETWAPFTNTAFGSSSQQTNYTWDLDNHLTQIGYPIGISGSTTDMTGHTKANSIVAVGAQVATGPVTRSYDQDGNLTSVSDWLGHTTSYGYDAEGNVTSIQRPDGSTATQTFDGNGAITQINDSSPNGYTFNAGYGRSGEELLTSDNETQTGATSYAYTYDGAARLASATQQTPVGGSPLPSSYSYDPADNLTATPTGASTTSQSYDAADQLTGASDSVTAVKQTFAYDQLGDRTGQTNTSTGQQQSYTYDQQSQLTSYTSAAQNSANQQTGSRNITSKYQYDGTGLRVGRIVNGTVTVQAYDISGALPQLLLDGFTAYVYGPDDLPIEQITYNPSSKGQTVAYYHHDELGSTRALTDSNGHPTATYKYDPYGNLQASNPTAAATTNPLLYAGQYVDSESGLQYLRARYYDPQTAQFLTRDPAVRGTRAPYSYALDKPVDFVDPSGEMVGCGQGWRNVGPVDQGGCAPLPTTGPPAQKKQNCGGGGPDEGDGGGGGTYIPPFDFPLPEIPGLEPIPAPGFASDPCPQQPNPQETSTPLNCSPTTYVDGSTQAAWRWGI